MSTGTVLGGEAASLVPPALGDLGSNGELNVGDVVILISTIVG